MDSESLKPQEVADMLKITRNMVYTLIRRGDLNGYRVGNKVRVDLNEVLNYKNRNRKTMAAEPEAPATAPERPALHTEECIADQGFIICGQDMLLDVLASFLEQRKGATRIIRSYAGSYTALCALYQGEVQMAAIHLWNGEKDEYNIPYVRMLLPGIHTVVIHLAQRMAGFCVAQGNPKGIRSWEDLKRGDLRIANRQKGSGSRILLDEHLKLLQISEKNLPGYQREFPTNLMAATTVAHGGADISVIDEKTASQIQKVEFIPLQKERFDIVLKKEDLDNPYVRSIMDIINSQEFKTVVGDIGGYDASETGNVTIT